MALRFTETDIDVLVEELEQHQRTFPQDLGAHYLFDAGVLGEIDVSTGSGPGHWKLGDASGELSPKKDIALPDIAKSIGLREDAIHGVAWAYPDPKYAGNAANTPQSMFKKIGGYIYYDDCSKIIAIKAVASASSLLKLGTPEECIECQFDRCPGATGFMDYQEVTIEFYRPYFSHFCWLPPETCEKLTPAHHDGCFSFKKARAHGFLIFPVAAEQSQGGFPQSLGPVFLSATDEKPASISQWSPLNLPVATRSSLGVPQESTGFAWGYGGGGLTFGSFVYSPGESVKKILPMEHKVTFGQAEEETLTRADLLCDSTWHEVRLFDHAKKYCWSKSQQESFVFQMDDGSIIRFPVSAALA